MSYDAGMSSIDSPRPPSPCVGVCRLGADGYCIGCLRSMDEIARWSRMDDSERLRLMREVLPMRRGSCP